MWDRKLVLSLFKFRIIRHFLNHSTKRWILSVGFLVFVVYCLTWTYPNRTFYTQQPSIVNHLNYNYMISPTHPCSKKSLLILVLSTIEAADKRRAIRNTWGGIAKTGSWPSRHIQGSVAVVFLFGVSQNPALNSELQRESDTHNDILQIDIMESYGYNVTRKILTAFKWAREYCSEVGYVMKVDDDIFIDVPAVVSRLHNLECDSSICGHKVIVAVTMRMGRYSLPFKEYPYLFIPPYLFGYFYVMPSKISSRLVFAAQYVPLLRMEDVYITAILSRVVGAQVKAFETFFAERNYGIDICDFVSGKREVSVDVSAKQMFAVWETYKNESICH